MIQQSELARMLNSYQNQITHLQNRAKHSEEELHRFKDKSQREEGIIADQYSELNKRGELLRDRQQKIKLLQEEENTRQRIQSASMIRIAYLLQQEEMSRKKQRDLKNIIQKLTEQRETQELQISILKDQNRDLCDQRQGLKLDLNQISILKDQNEELFNKLGEFIQKNRVLREQNYRLSRGILQTSNKLQKVEQLTRQTLNKQVKQVNENQNKIQIEELKSIIKSLNDSLEQKSKILERYDYELQRKVGELQNAVPKDNHDSYVSIKNAMKFISQQIKKKSQVMREITEKYSTYNKYEEENTKLREKLSGEIKILQKQVSVLKKQNQQFRKKLNAMNGNENSQNLQDENQYLKQIINQLLWQNQTCHLILYDRLGQQFYSEVKIRKGIIQEKFKYQKQGIYSPIDNRFLDVSELFNKNLVLMKELKKRHDFR